MEKCRFHQAINSNNCSRACVLRGVFPPYPGAGVEDSYTLVHRAYGKTRLALYFEGLSDNDKLVRARSLLLIANLWHHNPVGGPLSVFVKMQQSVERLISSGLSILPPDPHTLYELEHVPCVAPFGDRPTNRLGTCVMHSFFIKKTCDTLCPFRVPFPNGSCKASAYTIYKRFSGSVIPSFFKGVVMSSRVLIADSLTWEGELFREDVVGGPLVAFEQLARQLAILKHNKWRAQHLVPAPAPPQLILSDAVNSVKEEEKVNSVKEEEKVNTVKEEEKVNTVKEEEKVNTVKEEEEKVNAVKEEEEKVNAFKEEEEKVNAVKVEEEKVNAVKVEEEKVNAVKVEEEKVNAVKEEEEEKVYAAKEVENPSSVTMFMSKNGWSVGKKGPPGEVNMVMTKPMVQVTLDAVLSPPDAVVIDRRSVGVEEKPSSSEVEMVPTKSFETYQSCAVKEENPSRVKTGLPDEVKMDQTKSYSSCAVKEENPSTVKTGPPDYVKMDQTKLMVQETYLCLSLKPPMLALPPVGRLESHFIKPDNPAKQEPKFLKSGDAQPLRRSQRLAAKAKDLSRKPTPESLVSESSESPSLPAYIGNRCREKPVPESCLAVLPDLLQLNDYKEKECDSKWRGTEVWSVEKDEPSNPIGKGRPELCGCEFPFQCTEFQNHLREKRDKLELDLGSFYSDWKFDTMIEIAENDWTKDWKPDEDSSEETDEEPSSARVGKSAKKGVKSKSAKKGVKSKSAKKGVKSKSDKKGASGR